MRSTYYVSSVVLIIGCLSCSSGHNFSDVNTITLWRLDPKTDVKTTKEISSSGKVSEITSRIRLGRTHRCLCHHMEGMTLATPTGATEVSICSHCFEIEDGPKYDMPPGLYEVIQKAWR